MTARVEKVRVGLIAGSVLLLVVIAGVFSYARYRAAKTWLNRLKTRSGISIEQETDNFTYSQSVRGRTIFTLKAAKGFSHANGTWTLHNVVLTVYGTTGDRSDRVYGNTFEWDEKQGIAKAVGEVQMDLQVPGGVTVTQRHGSPATADNAVNSIHVKTSGLVFLRRLGVAATQEQIEFHYGGLTCIAKGAEFDSDPSALHLLADVQMNGELHGAPITLHATKVDFDRSTSVAAFSQPVMETQQRKARSETAVLHLRRDGSVETAEAVGNVTLDSEGTHLTAPRLDAVLNEKNQPQTARLSGGVRLLKDDASRPAQGEAAEVRVRFDAEGRAQELTATGGAHLAMREVGAAGAQLRREMRGDQLVAAFHSVGKGNPQLQQVHAVGHAAMAGDSLARTGLKSTNIAADDLLMDFVHAGDSKPHLDRMHGKGHTVMRQTAALQAEQTSTGDALDVAFTTGAPGRGAGQTSVVSATQVGHVSIVSKDALKPGAKRPPQVSTASAERAVYDDATERLSLDGGVHLADGGTSMAAESVVFDQRTGDTEAFGSVSATMTGNGPQAAHVSAQQAILHKVSQVTEFSGAAGKPVRLWQEASQVEAATILIDRQKNTLSAKPAPGGIVRSVFATEPSHPDAALAKAPAILRVESRLLEYSSSDRQAVFTGPVKLDGATGEVRGQKTTVFFTAPSPGSAKARAGEGMLGGGGSLDHVVVSGDVKLDQPGRHGTGEQLVYRASDASFVLTGTAAAPPRVMDAQQGTLTGASLLFRNGGRGGSTIVVAGAPGVGGQKPQRARIETRVRQKAQ